MKPPLFVRPRSEAERVVLRQGPRAPDAFTVRRCQVLLHSDRGLRPSQIVAALRWGTQTVRDAIRAFPADGLDCLRARSEAPETVHAAWPRDRDEDLCALLHQKPSGNLSSAFSGVCASRSRHLRADIPDDLSSCGRAMWRSGGVCVRTGSGAGKRGDSSGASAMIPRAASRSGKTSVST